jgi:hypothetical protein
MEVRPARPDEYEEAGRVTALAYREFVQPGETAWEAYLEEIADVQTRAARGEVLVAVDGSGSSAARRSSSGSASSPTIHRSRRMRRRSGCSGSTRMPAGAGSLGC